MIVDEMHHEHPELIRDQYWDEVFPAELPYTLATEGLREEHPLPSTAKIEVPIGQQGMMTLTPSSVKIDEMVKQDQTVSYKFSPAEVRFLLFSLISRQRMVVVFAQRLDNVK